jgi:hypothetical protein
VAFIPDDAMQRRRELTPAAWFVYEEFCRTRNHRLGLSEATRQEISEASGLAYRSVKNCLVELRHKSWIEEHESGVRLLVGDFSPVDKRHQMMTPTATRRHQIVTPQVSSNDDTQKASKRGSKVVQVSSNSDTPSSNNDASGRKVSSISDAKRHQMMTPPTPPNKDTSKEEPAREERESKARVEAVLLDYEKTVKRQLSDLHHRTRLNWEILIENRLNEGWDERKLHLIFVGCSKDKWPERKKFNGIKDLLGNYDVMDRMINLAKVADEIGERNSNGKSGNNNEQEPENIRRIRESSERFVRPRTA